MTKTITNFLREEFRLLTGLFEPTSGVLTHKHGGELSGGSRMEGIKINKANGTALRGRHRSGDIII